MRRLTSTFDPTPCGDPRRMTGVGRTTWSPGGSGCRWAGCSGCPRSTHRSAWNLRPRGVRPHEQPAPSRSTAEPFEGKAAVALFPARLLRPLAAVGVAAGGPGCATARGGEVLSSSRCQRGEAHHLVKTAKPVAPRPGENEIAQHNAKWGNRPSGGAQ